MRRLSDLLASFNDQENIKVRYIDWDHRIKYFEIYSFSQSDEYIRGELDSGEEALYPADSLHWILYQEGFEESAKAV